MRALIFLIVLASCSSKKNEPEVRVAGELRKIMMENNTSAAIDLSDIKGNPGLYALGAAENLDGEILIWNSDPFISKTVEDSINTTNTYEIKAALLVYAEVPTWSDFTIPTDLTQDELDSFLSELARENHLGQPFPFLIKGSAAELKSHVVKPGSAGHENHSKAGYNSVDMDEDVDILGFYSTVHKGIFTHHDSNMHVHFKFKHKPHTGHVDDLIIKKGSIVSLPELL